MVSPVSGHAFVTPAAVTFMVHRSPMMVVRAVDLKYWISDLSSVILASTPAAVPVPTPILTARGRRKCANK
jgi:hypothetical protein